jgi:hypothetical protein
MLEINKNGILIQSEKPGTDQPEIGRIWFSKLVAYVDSSQGNILSVQYPKDMNSFMVNKEIQNHISKISEGIIGIERRDRITNNSQIKFPSDLKSFVEGSNMPDNTLSKVEQVIQYLGEFLRSQNEEFRITPELFVDQEDESQEIKIKIEIKKDLGYIYERLRKPIYDIIIRSLPKEIRRRILINLEPL